MKISHYTDTAHEDKGRYSGIVAKGIFIPVVNLPKKEPKKLNNDNSIYSFGHVKITAGFYIRGCYAQTASSFVYAAFGVRSPSKRPTAALCTA